MTVKSANPAIVVYNLCPAVSNTLFSNIVPWWRDLQNPAVQKMCLRFVQTAALVKASAAIINEQGGCCHSLSMAYMTAIFFIFYFFKKWLLQCIWVRKNKSMCLLTCSQESWWSQLVVWNWGSERYLSTLCSGQTSFEFNRNIRPKEEDQNPAACRE